MRRRGHSCQKPLSYNEGLMNLGNLRRLNLGDDTDAEGGGAVEIYSRDRHSNRESHEQGSENI
jgi:hypothetical protein